MRKGTRFVGIPLGFSQRRPEECAPMGLKYLRQIAENPLWSAIS